MIGGLAPFGADTAAQAQVAWPAWSTEGVGEKFQAHREATKIKFRRSQGAARVRTRSSRFVVKDEP